MCAGSVEILYADEMCCSRDSVAFRILGMQGADILLCIRVFEIVAVLIYFLGSNDAERKADIRCECD